MILIRKENSGMILVLTLVMTSVFLSIALGFSVLIISDLNKARAIDNSIVAYYSAESGLEESLFILRKTEIDSVKKLKEKRTNKIRLPDIENATWDINQSTDYEEYFLRQRLRPGQSAKFFILNRKETQVKSFTLKWEKNATSTAGLQVSLTQLSPGTDSNNNLVFFTDTSEVELATGIVRCYDFKNLNLAGISHSLMVDYLVEIKVLGSDYNLDAVDRLEVKAYNNSCSSRIDDGGDLNKEGITNLTIKSTGIFGRSSQTITAYLPPKDLPSSLVGFVLFSDQDITKDSGIDD